MTRVIFRRGRLYLNWRYKWDMLPDLFSNWEAPVILDVMLDPRNPKPPDGWAMVDGSKPIDLDNLKFEPM